MKSCNNCQMAFFVDHGYSNYTTEGTYFYCGVKAHPNAPFDRFYGEEKRLEYAEQCGFFAEGDPVTMDVDRDNLVNNKMTLAQRILWDNYVDDAERPATSFEQYAFPPTKT